MSIYCLVSHFLNQRDGLITCTESGSFRLWKIDSSSLVPKLVVEHKVGAEICCAKKSPFENEKCLVATGGKENDLKVWSLDDMETPVYKAKKVADNWMRLREPVWIMSMDFLDKQRIVVGTAYHRVKNEKKQLLFNKLSCFTFSLYNQIKKKD